MQVDALDVSYGGAISVVSKVSCVIRPGDTVAVLGANGAGKTTLLRAVTGLLGFNGGRITAGTVRLDGEEVAGLDAPALVRRGVAQVLEGRRVFAPLTVEENLRAGAWVLGRRGRAEVERVLTTFPLLARKRRHRAGSLSGGEQQQLAIGRALVQSPRLLVLDEPTLGLAPILIAQVRDLLVSLRAEGVTVLLAEQRAAVALAVADELHVLSGGRIVRSGPPAELAADGELAAAYLGAP